MPCRGCNFRMQSNSVAVVSFHLRCAPVTTCPNNHSINNVGLLPLFMEFLSLKTLHSTYWMAGLANDAAHFFKFLFILALYTLAMTLFVSMLRISPMFQPS